MPEWTVGEIYAIIERDAHGDPVALHPVLPSETSVTVKDRKNILRSMEIG